MGYTFQTEAQRRKAKARYRWKHAFDIIRQFTESSPFPVDILPELRCYFEEDYDSDEEEEQIRKREVEEERKKFTDNMNKLRREGSIRFDNAGAGPRAVFTERSKEEDEEEYHINRHLRRLGGAMTLSFRNSASGRTGKDILALSKASGLEKSLTLKSLTGLNRTRGSRGALDKPTIELNRDQFTRRMTQYFGAKVTREELGQWFDDIDCDLSNSVSWDEFTSYAIHFAIGQDSENYSSLEYLQQPLPGNSSTEHKDAVRQIVHCPRGNCYVSCSDDGVMKVWNTSSLHLTKTINNTKNSAAQGQTMVGTSSASVPIGDMCYFGGHLLVCSMDKGINLYDTTKGVELVKRFNGRGAGEGESGMHAVGKSRAVIETTVLKGMTEIPTSLEVLSIKQREVMFVAMNNGSVVTYPIGRLQVLPIAAPLSSAKLHNGGILKMRYYSSLRSLVTGGWDGILNIVDPETLSITNPLNGGITGIDRHSKSVHDFSFSPATKTIASVGSEKDIFLWNPTSNQPYSKLQKAHLSHISQVMFNDADYQLISLSVDSMVKIWDTRMLKPFQSINTAESYHSSTAFTFDKQRSKIVVMAKQPSQWVMRRALSHFPSSHKGHSDSVTGVTCLDNGVVATGDTNMVIMWKVANGKRLALHSLATADGDRIVHVDVDLGGRRLIAVDSRGKLTIWNHRSGQLLKEVQPASTAQPTQVLHMQDKERISSFLVVVSPNEVCIWREADAFQEDFFGLEPDFIIPAPPDDKFTMAVCIPELEKGSPLLGCGTDSTALNIYALSSGLIIARMTHPFPSTKGLQGKMLKTEVEESRCISAVQELLGTEALQGRCVEDMVYLATKNILVTVCGENCIYFWDVHRAVILLAYRTNISPREFLICVATDKEDKFLFTACDNGFIYVRDVSEIPVLSPSSTVQRRHMKLKKIFPSHDGTIQRIKFCDSRALLLVQGTDMYIKLFRITGEYIGYFGQAMMWNLQNRSAFGLEGGGPPAVTNSSASFRGHPQPTEDNELTGGGEFGSFRPKNRKKYLDNFLTNLHEEVVEREKKDVQRRMSQMEEDPELGRLLSSPTLAVSDEDQPLSYGEVAQNVATMAGQQSTGNTPPPEVESTTFALTQLETEVVEPEEQGNVEEEEKEEQADQPNQEGQSNEPEIVDAPLHAPTQQELAGFSLPPPEAAFREPELEQREVGADVGMLTSPKHHHTPAKHVSQAPPPSKVPFQLSDVFGTTELGPVSPRAVEAPLSPNSFANRRVSPLRATLGAESPRGRKRNQLVQKLGQKTIHMDDTFVKTEIHGTTSTELATMLAKTGKPIDHQGKLLFSKKLARVNRLEPIGGGTSGVKNVSAITSGPGSPTRLTRTRSTGNVFKQQSYNVMMHKLASIRGLRRDKKHLLASAADVNSGSDESSDDVIPGARGVRGGRRHSSDEVYSLGQVTVRDDRVTVKRRKKRRPHSFSSEDLKELLQREVTAEQRQEAERISKAHETAPRIEKLKKEQSKSWSNRASSILSLQQVQTIPPPPAALQRNEPKKLW